MVGFVTPDEHRERNAVSVGVGSSYDLNEAERALAERVEAELALIERELLADVSFTSSIADAAAKYLLVAGGKRVRPRLMVLAAEFGGGSNERVRAAARAIELTHLASLYHDDVMDAAVLRRGVDTAHVTWSNSVAILAGDLLFARASKLVSQLGERAISLQANTFERLCLGQLHETVGVPDGGDPIAHYLQVLSDKTGSLIALAAQMGAVFSGAPDACEAPLVAFGEALGVAFQLTDDLLDLSPIVEQTGKRAGTDVRAGVGTLPVLLLRRAAPSSAAAAELLARIDACAAGELSDAEADVVIAQLREHDVTRETERVVAEWGQRATAALQELPAGAARAALLRLTDAVLHRTA